MTSIENIKANSVGYNLEERAAVAWRRSRRRNNCSGGQPRRCLNARDTLFISQTKTPANQRRSLSRGSAPPFNWYEPLTNSTADKLAAQRARDFHLGWFLHPIVYGEYPATMQANVGKRLPKFTDSEVKMVNGSMDFLGINHYTAYFAHYPHQKPPADTSYQMDWNADIVNERNGKPVGDVANSDWLFIVPWGMYKIVTYIKEHYQNPTMMITENGMDDPGNVTIPKALHDTRRINYYKSYLHNLKRAIHDGAKVTHYFAWSLLDNFEWRAGYTSRFGIVYIDFKDLKRYPKMSAYWFKTLLARKKA